MINSSFSFSAGKCFFFDFVILVALKEISLMLQALFHKKSTTRKDGKSRKLNWFGENLGIILAEC